MKFFFSVFFCIAAIIIYKQDILSTKINYLTRNTSQTESMSGNNDTSRIPDTMAVPRAIRQVVYGFEQAEGVGAVVRRTIGTPKLRNLSPFLMLDHFDMAPTKEAGFPDHPHRGMETITYLKSGKFLHEDMLGNRGELYPGDLQFMTAGRGIVHSEMPNINEDGTHNAGMQLWVDLPSDLKGCEPRYRDLRSAEIPVSTSDDGKVTIKVISGKSHGVDSIKDLAYTPVWYLDVTMQPGAKLEQVLPEGWNAFAYVLNGTVQFGAPGSARTVEQFNNAVFEQKGDGIVAETDADATSDTQFVLVAGLPHTQQTVQHGPFVAESREGIMQAFMDFQTRSNGFEKADGWESEIGKAMAH